MADEHDIGGKTEGPPEPPAKAQRSAPTDPASAGDAASAKRGEVQVDDLRRRIDQIDDQLMRLLNSRSACAVEIGRLKRRIKMPVYQPDRETWILDRVEKNNPGPLDCGAVRRVFERVIDESRRLERLAGEALETDEKGNGQRGTDNE
jgi:chorismate mutase